VRKKFPFFHFKISVVKSEDKRQKKGDSDSNTRNCATKGNILLPDECEHFATGVNASSHQRY